MIVTSCIVLTSENSHLFHGLGKEEEYRALDAWCIFSWARYVLV